jgi:hypothetical protein
MMYKNITRCPSALIVAICLFAPVVVTTSSFGQSHLTIFVDDSVATSGTGQSWSSPRKHLQDALADAQTWVNAIIGNEAFIHLAQGTYFPDRGTGYTLGNRDHSFILVKRTKVIGGFAGPGTPDPNLNDPDSYVTTLSGDVGSGNLDSFTVVKIQDSNNHYNSNGVIEGLTITGGYADAFSGDTSAGGGVRSINGASPRLHKIKISANSANGAGPSSMAAASALVCTRQAYTRGSSTASSRGTRAPSSAAELPLNTLMQPQTFSCSIAL